MGERIFNEVLNMSCFVCNVSDQSVGVIYQLQWSQQIFTSFKVVQTSDDGGERPALTDAAQCCHHPVAVIMDVKHRTLLLQSATANRKWDQDKPPSPSCIESSALYLPSQFRPDHIFPVFDPLRQSCLLSVALTAHHQLLLNASHTHTKCVEYFQLGNGLKLKCAAELN